MVLTVSEQTDADAAKGIGLATRWHTEVEAPAKDAGELTRMRDAAIDKLARIEPYVIAHNDPDFLAGLRFDLMNQDPPMSDVEADAELLKRTTAHNVNKARKVNKLRLMESEVTLRDRGDLDRTTELSKVS